MADTATVGILKTMLTMDTASFDSGAKKAVQGSESVQKSVKGLTEEVQKLTPQAERMVKAFQGDKLLYSANSLTQAVTKLGGATKLTEAEQAKVNKTLTDAIAKYKQLGKEAPQALLDLEKATRRVSQATDKMAAGMQAMGEIGRKAFEKAQASDKLIAGMSAAGRAADDAGKKVSGFSAAQSILTTRAIAFGSAIGSFAGMAAYDAIRRIGNAFLDAAMQGNKFVAISRSFDRLTASIDESAIAMLNASRGATKGLISDLDLMQSANKAILLGLPVTSKEMATLASTAVTLGRAMGQDATKSLDDLITALGRSSPLILDNLGLTVKLGEANEAYAKKIGKSADALTDAEKKTAFYNAAMEAARKKVDELGEIHLTLTDHINRLLTATGNIITKFGASANEAGIFARALGGLADAAQDAAENMDLAAQARERLEAAGKGAPDVALWRKILLLQVRSDIPRKEIEAEIDKILEEAQKRSLERMALTFPVPAPLGAPRLEDNVDRMLEADKLIRQTDELAQRLKQAAEQAQALRNRLFGRDAQKAATDAAAAIGNVANVNNLTADSLRQLAATLMAGIDAWNANGAAIPPNVDKLLTAIRATKTMREELEALQAIPPGLPSLPDAPQTDLETLEFWGKHFKKVEEEAAKWRSHMNFIGERMMEDEAAVLEQRKKKWREFQELVQGLFAPIVGGVVDAIGGLFQSNGRRPRKSDGLSAEEYTRQMRDFESRWESFWKRLGKIPIDIFKNILSMFVNEFLNGMIKALAGSAFGQAFGNWIAKGLGIAGGVGGGGLSALGGGTLMSALGIGGAAALPGAAAAPALSTLIPAAAPGATAGGTGAAGGGFLSGLGAAAPFAAAFGAPVIAAWLGGAFSRSDGERIREARRLLQRGVPVSRLPGWITGDESTMRLIREGRLFDPVDFNVFGRNVRLGEGFRAPDTSGLRTSFAGTAIAPGTGAADTSRPIVVNQTNITNVSSIDAKDTARFFRSPAAVNGMARAAEDNAHGLATRLRRSLAP